MTVRLNRRSMVTLMGVAPAYLLLPFRRFATIWRGETQAATPAPPQAVTAKTYRCPPCGLDCDKIIFDKPGVCPNCQMKLIPADGAESGLTTVAMLVFNGVQIIDFSGPWEVFGGAGFLVHTVAEKSEPVTTVYGEKLVPEYSFENCPKTDILLIPGGGVGGPMSNPQTMQWVQARAKETAHVMSVCNGAYILGQAGLLEGLPATTTYARIPGLAAFKAKPVHDQRWVENGKIITTAGLSSGIDGALYLVSKILGKGRAQAVALAIEYQWEPEPKFVRGKLADRNLPGTLSLGTLRIDPVETELVSTEGDFDKWEVRFLASGAGSATDIAAAVRANLAGESSYVQAKAVKFATGDAKESAIRWTLTDENKQVWKCSAVVAPAGSEKGKFDLIFRVERESRKA